MKFKGKQKYDLTKFYTSGNGSVIENSISAYMDINQTETEKKKKPRKRRKRAASQEGGEDLNE